MQQNLTESKQVKLLPLEIYDQKDSHIVRSAVRALLKPDCNMFQKGEIIRSLIILLDTNEKNVSSLLGLSYESVKRKLSLLCFSKSEQQIILKSGISEMSVSLLSKLPYLTRRFAVMHCTGNKLSFSQTKAYVDSFNKANLKFHAFTKSKSKVKLGFIKDIGFALNSIEKAVNKAKESGFDVKYEKNEDPDCFSISLWMPKKHSHRH